MSADIVRGDTLFSQIGYTSYPAWTAPAIDPVSGLIVTNVYDPAGAHPTLSAYTSAGAQVWTVADGTYFTGNRAQAIAAGVDKVVATSVADAAGRIDILSAATGSRLLAQFTVGEDSTNGYNFTAAAIG